MTKHCVRLKRLHKNLMLKFDKNMADISPNTVYLFTDIAAVVIASDYADMEKGHQFLPAIRELTSSYGILLIMDEIVTGFRLAIGGAHEGH